MVMEQNLWPCSCCSLSWCIEAISLANSPPLCSPGGPAQFIAVVSQFRFHRLWSKWLGENQFLDLPLTTLSIVLHAHPSLQRCQLQLSHWNSKFFEVWLSVSVVVRHHIPHISTFLQLRCNQPSHLQLLMPHTLTLLGFAQYKVMNLMSYPLFFRWLGALPRTQNSVFQVPAWTPKHLAMGYPWKIDLRLKGRKQPTLFGDHNPSIY